MKPVLAHFRLQACHVTFTLMIYAFRAPPLIVQYTRSLIQSLGFTFSDTPSPIPSQTLLHLGLVLESRAMMVSLGKAKKNISASLVNETSIKTSTGWTSWITDSSSLRSVILQGYGIDENTSLETSCLLHQNVRLRCDGGSMRKSVSQKIREHA